ncbi:MAG: non-heme iron oxygenase ferredoxin subunit [Candidatus Nanopelagicaceae bacterium]|nr:non-heme iron oxygenase ferredoxin subunit [Candidatus Nanopelagicaceae bacterium]
MSSTQVSFSDLVDGKPQKIALGDKDVCVARIGDDVFAVADMCTHSEASLSEGDISNYKIECWLHGAEFDLRTGAATTPPAVEALETFEVQRDGDTVTISSK